MEKSWKMFGNADGSERRRWREEMVERRIRKWAGKRGGERG